MLRLHLRDEGHDHVPPGTTVKYDTNPPTSGDHVEPPDQQADGAYSEMPATIDVVHSLEHGRLEIQYDPSLPERDQLELKGLYDTMYAGALLFPNPQMPYAGSGDDLDQPARLQDLPGSRDPGRDPRLRQGDLGEVRGRAGGGVRPADRAEPDQPLAAVAAGPLRALCRRGRSRRSSRPALSRS